MQAFLQKYWQSETSCPFGNMPLQKATLWFYFELNFPIFAVLLDVSYMKQSDNIAEQGDVIVQLINPASQWSR